jgi:multiple sugar transport system permease protein
MKDWWARHQRVVSPLLMMVPAVMLFGTFVVWPVATSFRISLLDWDGIGPERYVGLANYLELIGDATFWQAAGHNLVLVLSFALAPIGGFLLAWQLTRGQYAAALWRTAFLIPFVLSQAVVGLIFALLLNSQFGIGAFFGIPGILDSSRNALFGVIGASLWPHIAYCIILYMAGIAQLDPSLTDAGRIDGAGGWSFVRWIILPQLAPTSIVVLVVSFVSAMRSFDIVSIMTNGGPGNGSIVLSLLMYQETFLSLRFGYGAAIAVVLFLLMSVGTVVFVRVVLWTRLRR